MDPRIASYEDIADEVLHLVREIPDFPTEGILFRDATPIYQNPRAFSYIIDHMVAYLRSFKLNALVAAESRGFISGAVIAQKLEIAFIPMRKAGKLPSETTSLAYGLEYGMDELHVHSDAIDEDSRVVVHDDLLATGGTANAMANLVELLGGKVATCCFMMELLDLKGYESLGRYDVYSVLRF